MHVKTRINSKIERNLHVKTRLNYAYARKNTYKLQTRLQHIAYAPKMCKKRVNNALVRKNTSK